MSASYLFNIVVSRIKLINVAVADPKEVSVNVKFGTKKMVITHSRINVKDFQPTKAIQMKGDVANMRQQVAQPIQLTVRRKGKTVGEASVKISEDFLDKIDPKMGDTLETMSAKIASRDEDRGKIEIIVYLVAKCDEPVVAPDAPPDLDKSTCRNLGTAINEADIMFSIGEFQPCEKPLGPCQDELVPEEGDERLQLDLTRYKSIFQEQVRQVPEQSAGFEACDRLKQMTLQCGSVIDSLIRKMNEKPSPLPNNEARFTDWSGKGKAYKVKYVERSIPVPVGEIKEEMGLKPIRFCPICLTAMSWLPKYAKCPTCNTKAMPEVELIEQKWKGNEIIEEVLKRPKKKRGQEQTFCYDPCEEKRREMEEKEMEEALGGAAADDEEPDNTECRCICRKGKMCAHCRIQNLCNDLLKEKSVESLCPGTKVNEIEDYCVIVDEEEQDCRPYLDRVFEELRDLYEKRDAKKVEELNKRCTQSLLRLRALRGDDSDADMFGNQAGMGRGALGEPSFMHRIPQPKIGHKTCVKSGGNVSRNHGWNWPTTKKARKHGWRPGAICRYVGAIMKFFLQTADQKEPFHICRRAEQEDKENSHLPILNICKQDGAIYVTLRPGNDPNVKMNPITFKIVKSDMAKTLSKIKRKLKDKGFSKCRCHRSLMLCVCRHYKEKKLLESVLQKECQRRGWPNLGDHLVLTDTSQSEMEYDFDVSAPSWKDTSRLKPKAVNHETQTVPADLNVIPKYPVKLDPYWRAYDCAAGDRYTGTAFGAPGEEVFEDGVFGFGGGGPHGASAAPGGRAKPPGVWGAGAGGPMGGGGRGGAGAGGGRGGPAGPGIGGKGFPGTKRKPGEKRPPAPPIPVRMTDKYYKQVDDAAKAKKQAEDDAIKGRAKGIDLISYLEKKGAVKMHWDPNEPKPEVKTKTGPVVGKDGLTDAQRKRKELLQVPIPPFDALAKLGKGFDPCSAQCYQSCAFRSCYPCYNYV